MRCSLHIFLVFLQLCMLTEAQINVPPNIILIYADDLGWNDVSFHGSQEIPTPNLDALAMSGILLNNYYGMYLCTPSRAALLSGKYPIRLGLQHYVFLSGEASGMPLDVVTLPQRLKELGYATHMIGKWHLGYMRKEYTPTYRGFDSFFGYFNGLIDYFDYTSYGATGWEDDSHFYGIDLQNGTDVVRNFRGRYATEVFTEKAEEIIMQHNPSKPLFMYLSHLAVHTGNSYMPQQAPQEYVNRVKYIKNKQRRVLAGTMVALDDSVGQVFRALDQKGMLQNSIIVFASDNGGQAVVEGGVSSNYPLRGKKETMWEGGNRCVSLIWSPLFNLQRPRISKQLMHVTDWLPTFYKAAGGDPSDLGEIDGKDMWDALIGNMPSPRTKLLHNVDPIYGISALRVGDMKVVNGSTNYDSWYNTASSEYLNVNQEQDRFHHGNEAIVRNILINAGWWILKDTNKWRKSATVTCTQPPPADGGGCKPSEKPCLFNIAKDPCEYHNLAEKYPQVVDRMMKEIYAYEDTAVEPRNKLSDPRANPDCHNFAYVPWLEPEHYNECTEFL